MIRKTIIVLFAVAAAASVGLGVYSFHRGIPDETIWISSLTRGQHVQTALVRGVVHVVYTEPYDRPSVAEAEKRLAGFYFKKTAVGMGDRIRLATGVGGPVWAASGLLAAYPALALYCGPVQRRRRRRAGACTCCGYSLTGNTSGICPECGSGTATQHEPIWDAVLWVLGLFRPRRVMFVLCTLATAGTALAWGMSYVRSLESGSSAQGLTVLLHHGTAAIRCEPVNYQMLKCRTVRADVVNDWGVVRVDRAFERAADGSITAPTPYETTVEVDLWLPTLLLASYPVGALIGLWRRRRQVPQVDSRLSG